VWTIITPFVAATDSRAKRLAAALGSCGLDARVIGCAASPVTNSRVIRRYQKYKDAIKQIRGVRGGVVVCVNAECTLIARAMKLLRLAHFESLVTDVYDHHAYIFEGSIGWIFHRIERLAIKAADAAIIPIKARLAQYQPPIKNRELERIFYISNLGFENSQSKSFLKESNVFFHGRRRSVLVYAGTIDAGRGLNIIAEAAAAFSADLDVRIYGSGPLLKEYLKYEDFRRVYRGPFDVSSLPNIYEAADVICGFYELSVRNHIFCDPNKLREVFEFDKPLLTNSGTPLSERVESLGVGHVLNNLTIESVCDAALEMVNQKLQVVKRIDASRGNFDRLVGENGRNLEKLIGYLNG
jgi:glycosyltransferase involved in cell wall biosynthesis